MGANTMHDRRNATQVHKTNHIGTVRLLCRRKKEEWKKLFTLRREKETDRSRTRKKIRRTCRFTLLAASPYSSSTPFLLCSPLFEHAIHTLVEQVGGKALDDFSEALLDLDLPLFVAQGLLGVFRGHPEDRQDGK